MNYSPATRQRIADIHLGIRVDRASSVLPQNTTTTYFEIFGGNVLMTLLVGELSVAVGGACNLTINHDPDDGASAAIGATLDIDTWTPGDILTISGLLTDNIIPAVVAGSASPMSYKGVILSPGDLEFVTDASRTGNWIWSLWYVPLEAGAYVAVA